MSFHRTVMRNRARRLGGNRYLSDCWPMVRALNWQARGSYPVVWTSKNKGKTKITHPKATRAVAPQAPSVGLLKKFMRDIADTANSMAFLRARAQGR